MGNRNGNEENNNINNGVHEQILVQNGQNNTQLNIDPPSVKRVYAVRNPFYIKKISLVLEKDAGPSNIYYIKFNYTSLVDFNCYINFEVSRNPTKPLVPKEMSNLDNYILSYIPSDKFVSKSIVIKNLPKGDNMEFFEKEGVIDIDYFNQNKLEKINADEQNKNKIYDVSIELVPIFEDSETNKNEVVFISLCTLETNEIERHPHSLKIELQRLKTFGMWIDIHDIYNSSLDNGECLICCTNLRNTIFLPCRHACTCNTCAHSLKMRNNPCPICKNAIKDLLIIDVDENSNNINSNFRNNSMINEAKNDNILETSENNNNILNNISNNDNMTDDEEKIKINDEE